MYYGFDIGGTKVAFAVFDDDFNERERETYATPGEDYPAFVEQVGQRVAAADRRWHCRGKVGLGFPGMLRPDDGQILAPNVPVIHGQTLVADVQHRLARPVYAGNDANCFLLSEYHQGAAAGTELVLALTLGTGVGGALLHQGRLLGGLQGGCGEFGHGGINATLLLRYPELPLFSCGCGRQACLETYVSGTGLGRLYLHCSGRSLSGREIIQAWQQQQPEAVLCLDMYLNILAAGIGDLVTQLDPGRVVLGGGLSDYPWLYRQLAERLPGYLMHGARPPTIVAPHFGGAGGVRGAALLAKYVA
ncbi:ROK family protein [Zobellella maritima]|uniref:ROK family protein n=1 Tax=Zobellella maritima TaxID=2059725 RepID=UPI000E3025E3|nr:ROK family protein [Zobellella maritima]